MQKILTSSKIAEAGHVILRSHVAVMLFFFSSLLLIQCKHDVIQNTVADITSPADEKKIDSLIGLLSLEEKVAMLSGNGLFSSPGIERLGIRDLQYTDGPFGIREELDNRTWAALGLTTDSATFFPTGSALAAAWNTELAYKYGLGLGEEAKNRGKDIVLGPAVNINRTPLNGRTYEYLSEDPMLNSALAVGYVKGVQSAGVAACVKHFAVNNQETKRGEVDVDIDERALREIYLPPFRAAVTEGGAFAVMSAYNKLRGQYCAENEYLLNNILREEWKFQGMVVSDWGGTHSTVQSALNGLDVEMGSDIYFKSALLDSVKQGLVPESVINEKVRRILRVYFFAQRKPVPEGNPNVSTPEHNKIAYEVAAQSIVLLKNKRNSLPLDTSKLKSITVIGENAIRKHAQGGFGAGVKARYEITPLEGLRNRLGNAVNIEFVQGYQSKFLPGQRFVPDNTVDKKLIDEAVSAAERSEVVLLFIGNNREVETENFDRLDIMLPFGQDELIRAVCAANPNTILIVVAGAPTDLHAADSCSGAILWSWFNGSQGGLALADVILGRINPSGKLPFTIPAKLSDSPAHALGNFPGNEKASYTEGIFVGYRWFDAKDISPAYPFGYGLSYTTFAYNSLLADKKSYSRKDVISLTVKVQNNGNRDGMETVQLYASEIDPQVEKPVRELKAFGKISIPAGKVSEIKMEIPVSALAWFDDQKMEWIVTPGKYRLYAGTSSRDIRKIIDIDIK